ncbi:MULTISPECIES: dTDP-4-dehydrorhamnose 3,5-epimerase [Rhodomicrobium]|uniref:dTDP-4-dehydrorhamnose 3,5-epimerase n=1 Tax=Rhodomicrobium TaxID=1068 RepID=UPI000B4A7E40|nr:MULTISPECIES: dTDP-4-dehydrorhamnose 3,5-epimerase [Rhodomicrobium]
MKVHAFEIDGPLLIEPTRFQDSRGFFCETYNALELARHGVDTRFVQDNQSLSTACGTVRGLHFQSPPYAQAKLIRVVRGAILDVAVDIRAGSPSFGRHVSVELSAENALQLYIPEGFAHGFATLRPLTDVAYKVSAPYAPEHDLGIFWADPGLAIQWPVTEQEAVLSRNDANQPSLRDIVSPFVHGTIQSEVAA